MYILSLIMWFQHSRIVSKLRRQNNFSWSGNTISWLSCGHFQWTFMWTFVSSSTRCSSASPGTPASAAARSPTTASCWPGTSRCAGRATSGCPGGGSASSRTRSSRGRGRHLHRATLQNTERQDSSAVINSQSSAVENINLVFSTV